MIPIGPFLYSIRALVSELILHPNIVSQVQAGMWGIKGNRGMSSIVFARAQTGVSLGFHIILAVLGVGLPVLLFLAEGLALRSGDKEWLTLAKSWSKAFAILFAVGAVSGTILSFEFGLLWPTFMRFAGGIIGLPFALEGFAFFIEAIFLGLYLYGWERLSPLAHWLCTIPLMVAGAASTWFIVTVNAWMNTPTGFTYHNGVVSNVDPIAAIFNPSTPFETTHMLLAAYVTTGFGVAMLCALGMLRGNRATWLRRGLLLSMSMAIVSLPLQIIAGDLVARDISQTQPAKFAAMEAQYHTQNGAPLRVFGIPNDAEQRNQLSVEIPHGLSLLATGDPNGQVKGLDAFPANSRPDPQAVHIFFDMMVGSGFLILVVAALFWFAWWRRGRVVPENRWLLRGIVVAGPLAYLALECGWIVTEEGRQPYIIYGIMRVAQASTTAPGVGLFFLGFGLVYVALAITTVVLLRRISSPSRGTVGDLIAARTSGGQAS